MITELALVLALHTDPTVDTLPGIAYLESVYASETVLAGKHQRGSKEWDDAADDKRKDEDVDGDGYHDSREVSDHTEEYND